MPAVRTIKYRTIRTLVTDKTTIPKHKTKVNKRQIYTDDTAGTNWWHWCYRHNAPTHPVMPPECLGASPISGGPEPIPGGLATGPSPPRWYFSTPGESVALARDALAPRLRCC
ncbi:uncharacterized protein LOC110188652 [Drosophila serrata]|uniref:uncharacterized protein LOC110188652 n=1 Tax=Drosophila serrata TaxID=7274 RepID=UPI000A1D1ACB|nr:uncharacterized protein LOC110188652 [Drosophila serrata]